MTHNCPHCAAPMNLGAVTQRNVECEYCHQFSMLPDNVWKTFKTRIDQANAQQQAAAARANALEMQKQGFKHAGGMMRRGWILSLVMTAGIIGFVYFLQNRIQNQVRQNIKTATGSTRSSSSGGSRTSGGGEAPRKAVVIDTVKLTFKSDPTGAEIYIDGRKLDGVETPATVDQRKTSDVVLVKLKKEGYVPAVKKVTPDADQIIELKLEK